MAFNQQQTKQARVVVVIVVLIAVVVLAAVVLSGSLTAKPATSGTQAGSASGSATISSTVTTGSSTESSSTGSSASGTSTGTGSNAGTSSSSTTSSGTPASMDQVDQTYGTAAKQLLAQYQADSSNPSALLNLANGYYDWGAAALQFAKDEAGNKHVADLYRQALNYYDSYLQNNPDSKSVQVDRAISIFYTGDHATATSTLEAFVQKNPDFGPAWANLGVFYESDGKKDQAKEAYQKAIDVDPNDTYQVKTFAQQRLNELNN